MVRSLLRKSRLQKRMLNINGPLVFMDSVGYIGKFAFAHCEYLRGSLTFNNTSLNSNSFEGCKRLGPVLTLGKNTDWDDSLGMYSHSFHYCCGIKKVVNKTNKKLAATPPLPCRRKMWSLHMWRKKLLRLPRPTPLQCRQDRRPMIQTKSI